MVSAIVPIFPNNDTLARLSCCVVTSQCFELLSTGPSNRDHIHNRSGKKKIANKDILYNITFTINQKLEHIVKTFSLSLKRHLNPLVGYQRGTVIDTTPEIVTLKSERTTELQGNQFFHILGIDIEWFGLRTESSYISSGQIFSVATHTVVEGEPT